MPFLDHLEELRHRLFWIAGAILVGVVASFIILSQKRVDLVGVLAGLWGARALSGMVSNLLFGVGPTEPRYYIAAGAFVIVIAAMAAWAPIRRATGIDPKVAMRDL